MERYLMGAAPMFRVEAQLVGCLVYYPLMGHRFLEKFIFPMERFPAECPLVEWT